MSISLNTKYFYRGQPLRNKINKIMFHVENNINTKIPYVQKFPNLSLFKTMKNRRKMNLNIKHKSIDSRNHFKNNEINLNSFFSSKTNRATSVTTFKKFNTNFKGIKRSSSTSAIIRKFEFNKKKMNKQKSAICLLNNNFHVKNFSVNPNKVIDYLELNNNRKLFYSSIDIKNNKDNINQKIDKNDVNIKNLFGIDNNNKTKKKNDKNYKFLRENNELKKSMKTIKNKIAKECLKLYPTAMAYNSKLLLETMKIYKKTIHHLQDKNSVTNKNNIQLYNRFLNAD